MAPDRRTKFYYELRIILTPIIVWARQGVEACIAVMQS